MADVVVLVLLAAVLAAKALVPVGVTVVVLAALGAVVKLVL